MNTFGKILLVLCIVTFGFFLNVGNAAAATEEEKLIAILDGTSGDLFGWSVSVYDDTAVIGAADDDGKGSAYVFIRSGGTWAQQAKLTPSDSTAVDSFGDSVSVYGDTAVIGAGDSDSYKGSAYVFIRSGGTWTQQAKLTASDGFGRFGDSVSVYGDTAVIGAPYDNSDKGSAYVFTRSGGTWTQQANLTASDGVAYDVFGDSVSVYGDTTVIGAYSDDGQKGSAYVFNRSGGIWMQQDKLTTSDGTAGDSFGRSVSVYGDTAVIGAPIDDGYKGSAYVFSLSIGQPPEADIRFDPTLKDIKVYNSETGNEAGYIVLHTKKGNDGKEMLDKDGETGWELRQYTLNDPVSNSLVLVLEHKKDGNEAMVKVLSTQYNGGKVLTEVKNKMQAEYSTERNGALMELEQDVEVSKQFNAEAKYSAQKGKTEIKVDIEGQNEQKETRAGIVILELLTDKGSLKLRY